ncbi:MAG: non-hydrolyzing UDP-N-acetylglucosamine 2-epimerase, partial [Nitrosopumilaceae archaeon]
IGVRPEVVKMAPLVKLCEALGIDHYILHTGQHYSEDLDKKLFDDLNLRTPEYILGVGSATQGKQTASIISATEQILLTDTPDLLLVYGDSNSTMGAAVAASKLSIPVGHVEAGLRSNDKTMPEEINRIITDHVSDYLFAPTEGDRQQLLKEGISNHKIFVTGNTVVDSIYYIKKLASTKSKILKQYGLKKNSYLLLTLHRPHNVDNKDRLRSILTGLDELHAIYNMPIVFPIHPRTGNNIDKFNIQLPKGVIPTTPLGYIDFVYAQSNARLVLTDSGSVQEETCILKVPCITIRDNTERPDTITVGSNILCKTDSKSILNAFNVQMKKSRDWENPYGDGHAAEKIIDSIISTDDPNIRSIKSIKTTR